MAMISVLSWFDARDRALLTRCAVDVTTSPIVRAFWLTVTHLGGATCAIAVAVLPLFFLTDAHVAATDAIVTLVVSHLVVQIAKRSVGRPRPSRRTHRAALVGEPDRFSFPSGHAAASMSVAFVYALAYPAVAIPLVLMAGVVGLSRAVLGVHYPGDILAGQLLAVLTGLFVVAY